MNDSSAAVLGPAAPSYIDQLLFKGQQLCQQHRLEHPDLYLIVDRKKEEALEKENVEIGVAPPFVSKFTVSRTPI